MPKNTTKINIKDRVRVKSGKEHDDMTKDAVGTIVEISTPALGIKFDGMEKVHKWYTDDEVEKVDNEESMTTSKIRDWVNSIFRCN